VIVRRVGTALCLTVFVGIAVLGGCRDGTGPSPAIASPTSYDAADAADATVDYEDAIIPALAVRAPDQVHSNRAAPGWVVCGAFRCVLHRSEQPADQSPNLD
jgi:hypothetical protein